MITPDPIPCSGCGSCDLKSGPKKWKKSCGMLFSVFFPEVVTVIATTEGVTAFATATKLSLMAFRPVLCTVTGVGPPSLTSLPLRAKERSTPPLKFDTRMAPKSMPTVTSTSDVRTVFFMKHFSCCVEDIPGIPLPLQATSSPPEGISP